jgi:hypothetical protein
MSDEDSSGVVGGLLAIVRENLFLLVGLGLGAYALVSFGYVDVPEFEPPDGTAIIATGSVAAAIGGYIAAGKIAALLPDPEGVYLVEFQASDEQGGAVYELSEDQFADVDVQNGTLFQWPTAKRVYECRSYDPEANVAVANWRESVAGSQLAGDASVVEAFASIEELRKEFEPESRKYRHLQRRIRGIVRKLDERRLADQQAIIDETLAPEFGNDDATVSAVLREELPDELLPESMKGETMEDVDREIAERNGHEGEHVGFELLDDGEALDVRDDS